MEKVQASKKMKALSKYQVLQGDEILPAILGKDNQMVWVARDLKHNLPPTLLLWAGTPSTPDQIAQSPI